MKVIETNKSVALSMQDSIKQSISEKNVAKATYFLRNKIYSDKIKAALTEPVCNAIDEHRKYGITKPVEIFISYKEVCIRDFAKGLSKEDVQKIFFQYFESTKSNSDEGIGGFGIGAKAPSAYTDVFYVISYFEGKKTLYISAVSGYESYAHTVYEVPCDEKESGICVKIPINQNNKEKDYLEFVHIAQDLTRIIGFNSSQKELNLYIDEDIEYDSFIRQSENYKTNKLYYHQKLKESIENNEVNDTICYIPDLGCAMRYYFQSSFFNSSTLYAYDGDMLYPVPFAKELLKDTCVDTWYDHKIILFFKRGELSISPSRETIELTSESKQWFNWRLKSLFTQLKERHFAAIKKYIKDNKGTLVGDAVNKYAGSPTHSAITQAVKTNYDISRDMSFAYTVSPLYSEPTIYTGYGLSLLRKNYYFILADKRPSASRKQIAEAVFKYKNISMPNDRSLFIILYGDTVKKFKETRDDYKFEDIPYFVDDVNVFEYNSLKNYLPKRVKTKKEYILTDYYSGDVIKDIDYKNTLVISKQEYKNNYQYNYICDFNTNEREQLFGIKYRAILNQKEYKEFSSKCLTLETFSICDKIKSILKEKKVTYVDDFTDMLFLIFNLKPLINIENNIEKSRFTTTGTLYKIYRTAYSLDCIDKQSKREERIKKFKEYFSEEEIKDIITLITLNNYHLKSYFYNEQIKLSKELSEKYKSKVIDFIKTIDFTI